MAFLSGLPDFTGATSTGKQPPEGKFLIAKDKPPRVVRKNTRNYKLNCERKIDDFKVNFKTEFIKKLDRDGNSFDEHYKSVKNITRKNMMR